MNKKTWMAGALLFIVTIIFIVADYFAVFGTTEKSDYVLHEVVIRPVDNQDNSPIVGTRVKCFQRGNINACTQRESGKLGIVSALIPGSRISTHSLLFEQQYRYTSSRDPKINIMLINFDYMNEVISIEVNELFENPGKIIKVKMEARDSDRSTGD
ncbi:MAG: hypothetical protein ACI909_003120 [Planctomycetota bacterium]|jgi:hypothetical protein